LRVEAGYVLTGFAEAREAAVVVGEPRLLPAGQHQGMIRLRLRRRMVAVNV
jgi:hypothetical protein